ncbi:hypothetical protein ISN76_11805 [Dyella halodurans]|uniref:Nuclear transport factor 2 family protein n=1 Tax=Dyella halodurans TaxID=1920171 RepID=A0ABV9C0W7_9GAMM|nr:hypothetical protein [Dyella halodurans]
MRKIRSKILFCTVALAVLAGCRSTPDEALIRQGIDAAANAAEHAHASALAEVLSEDFDGNAGALARSDLLQLLRAAALRGETIHALSGPVELEQRGERYVARFTVTLTSGGKLLPAQMGVYQVETAWRRDGHQWLCYSATWVPQM